MRVTAATSLLLAALAKLIDISTLREAGCCLASYTTVPSSNKCCKLCLSAVGLAWLALLLLLIGTVDVSLNLDTYINFCIRVLSVEFILIKIVIIFIIEISRSPT